MLGLLDLIAPLLLLRGVLGLAALRRRVLRVFAFLIIEDRPNCLFSRVKLVAISNSSLESTSGLLPS
jgi:hypothetical protein